MDVRRTELESVDPNRVGGVEHRGLSDVLDADAVTINHYVIAPGDRISGLHAHQNQEEVFLVLDGAVTLETLDGTVVVDEGEVVRVAPGEFQSVTNPNGDLATVLALGAPRDQSELRVPVGCPECDAEVAALDFTGGDERLVCPVCGHDRGAACPDCGGELRAELDGDGRPVSVCLSCDVRMRER